MASLECKECGLIVEAGVPSKKSKDATIRCHCGGRMVHRAENLPNEMRDMDNELGRDE